MAIAFDATSTGAYQTANSRTWSHTCTGSDRVLIIGVSMLSVAGTTVTGITYNGVALTKITSQASVSGACRVELWELIAPTTGANNVVVSLSAVAAFVANAVSFTGANQTEPAEGYASTQATNIGANDASVDFDTYTDNIQIINAVATDDTTITANETSRQNVAGALGSGGMSTKATASGSESMSWTGVGALATWSIAAVAIRPVPNPTQASPLTVERTGANTTTFDMVHYDTVDYAKHSLAAGNPREVSSTSGDQDNRIFIEFPLTYGLSAGQLPASGVTVTGARLRGFCSSSQDDVRIRGITAHRPSTATAQQAFEDIASGSAYTAFGIDLGGAYFNITLNATALSELQTAISGAQAWFGIGTKLATEAHDDTSVVISTDYHTVILEIDYEVHSGGQTDGRIGGSINGLINGRIV